MKTTPANALRLALTSFLALSSTSFAESLHQTPQACLSYVANPHQADNEPYTVDSRLPVIVFIPTHLNRGDIARFNLDGGDERKHLETIILNRTADKICVAKKDYETLMQDAPLSIRLTLERRTSAHQGYREGGLLLEDPDGRATDYEVMKKATLKVTHVSRIYETYSGTFIIGDTEGNEFYGDSNVDISPALKSFNGLLAGQKVTVKVFLSDEKQVTIKYIAHAMSGLQEDYLKDAVIYTTQGETYSTGWILSK